MSVPKLEERVTLRECVEKWNAYNNEGKAAEEETIEGKPLDRLGLTYTAYGRLRRGGIDTIGQLEKMYLSGALERISGVGKKTMQEAGHKLGEAGLLQGLLTSEKPAEPKSAGADPREGKLEDQSKGQPEDQPLTEYQQFHKDLDGYFKPPYKPMIVKEISKEELEEWPAGEITEITMGPDAEYHCTVENNAETLKVKFAKTFTAKMLDAMCLANKYMWDGICGTWDEAIERAQQEVLYGGTEKTEV